MIGIDSGLIAVVLGLALFGVGFAVLVAWLGRKKEGFTSLLVVAGVLVTLGGAALVIGLPAALVVLVCFGASGLPMVIGDVAGYVSRREREREELKAVILGRAYDESKSLAQPGGMGAGRVPGTLEQGAGADAVDRA
jgi:hypothetical protein